MTNNVCKICGNNKDNIILENVVLKETQEIPDGIAIMIETYRGYEESTTNTWPEDMIINKTLSGCIDGNGNKLEDALSFDNGIVNISTSNTAHCYLYFYKPSLGEYLTTYPTNGFVLEDNADMYRYQGIQGDVDNYICFGTTNQERCIEESDKFMYRIIGVEIATNRLKLIKDYELDFGIPYGNYIEGVAGWEGSIVKENINTSFLENDIPTGWSTIISDNTWSYNLISSEVLLDSSPIDIHILENDGLTVEAKIGLMNISDYQYSTTLPRNCAVEDCLSWMYKGYEEWTMTALSEDEAWGINSDGNITSYLTSAELNIRPVFYLLSDEPYTSGSGTSDDPFILEQPVSE